MRILHTISSFAFDPPDSQVFGPRMADMPAVTESALVDDQLAGLEVVRAHGRAQRGARVPPLLVANFFQATAALAVHADLFRLALLRRRLSLSSYPEVSRPSSAATAMMACCRAMR
ncbi:hypothetical protein ACP_0375 [Acidobacterium capsulatum ATCC 51196]|uniref:Uncharacterized protein n=1 Tax=Acidobacterium capsulatum (strain ATCC 51196 / DSM 11244 / BCRC 80197 / JCM 7670 / NBRC 15755 / NCIMB 13165 / 161) TaxID=240015 RepID=C1F9Z6_ACIC5|nr:hypothetical protein ACP_0375 [Acidobacterium capsulatum ATCC 51196]